MHYLVIDIGGTFTKYALMNEEGAVFDKGKIPTVTKGTEEFLESLISLKDSYDAIDGIAISSAGVIDSEKGYMYNGGSLNFLKEISLARILEERCQVPVSLENDAKCAILAELWKGSLEKCQNAMVMILGTAVGGAVVINRELVRGNHLMAGEFSYLLTDRSHIDNPDYVFANSGGVPALLKMVSERKSIPLSDLSGEQIFNMIKSGDTIVSNCLRDYARTLATQLLNFNFILNPDKIAIGGGISEQPLLLKMIKEEMLDLIKVYPYSISLPDVVKCHFNNDANLLGALYVHLKQFHIRNI